MKYSLSPRRLFRRRKLKSNPYWKSKNLVLFISKDIKEYNKSKYEYVRSTRCLYIISVYLKDFYWKQSGTLLKYLAKTKEEAYKKYSIIKDYCPTYNDFFQEIYYRFLKYIQTAPNKPFLISQLRFYIKKTICFAIDLLCQKRVFKYEQDKYICNTYTSQPLIYSNNTFYKWFYRNLEEDKSIYVDIWEQLPISKELYCKFIKEVKNEWH